MSRWGLRCSGSYLACILYYLSILKFMVGWHEMHESCSFAPLAVFQQVPVWENIDIYMELHTIVYNLFYSNHPTNSIFSMWSTLNYHGTGVSMLFTHCFTLVFHVETFVLCGFKISVGQRVNIGQYCLML